MSWFFSNLTDLSEGSFGSEQLVEEADGDAEHGGQSQAPADHLAPPWVHVHRVVRQRLVVHQVEQEDTLKWQRSRVTGAVVGDRQEAVGLTMQTHGVMNDQHHFIQGNGR